jgi:hypothetical protein
MTVTPPLAISCWSDFGGPLSKHSQSYLRVHVARAGEGVVVDEDTGVRHVLGPPDGLDGAFMQIAGFMSEDASDTGPAAWVADGLPGFYAAKVPVDHYAGQVQLRLEVDGREPVRFTPQWPAWKRPEVRPAAKPKRARQARKVRT